MVALSVAYGCSHLFNHSTFIPHLFVPGIVMRVQREIKHGSSPQEKPPLAVIAYDDEC